MGAGKTTVVAPLLALMLADGDSLVLSVVPKALLEMTRKLMRETFATIMCKRVYTLQFDRSTDITPATAAALSNAAKNRGVVVATPTTIKSVMLCYIETLHNLHDASAQPSISTEKLQSNVVELEKTLRLFKDGVMLLDEVDLLLHPLKSELNFPCGEKFDLDAAECGERWGLPIHLIDALFFSATGTISVYEQQGTALALLRQLASRIQEGFDKKALQRLPHLTLLNKEFYHARMKPVLAEWSYLWLQMQHLHGISKEEAVQYVLEGAAAKSETVTKAHLIQQEIKSVEVQLGLASEKPEPTVGLKRSGSSVAKAWEQGNDQLLLRKSSSMGSVNGKEDEYLEAKLVELRAAGEVSEAQSDLNNQIYLIDQQFEAALKAGATKLAQVQLKITQSNKEIEDLETPHDASLDNSVVVWYSKAFGSAAGDNVGSISQIHAICSLFEDQGMTVVRCSSTDEVNERVKPLQAAGRLRCVVMGGGEDTSRCGPSCEEYHSSRCLICREKYTRHNNHMCDDGRRGTFALEGNSSGLEHETIQMVQRLLGTKTNVPSQGRKQFASLPANRLVIYGGESKISVAQRLMIWDNKVRLLQETQVHLYLEWSFICRPFSDLNSDNYLQRRLVNKSLSVCTSL